MSRDWKPGDVGLVNEGERLFRTLDRGWVDDEGDSRSFLRDSPRVRPLVVIDPEDREQVVRLAESFVRIQGERDHAAVWNDDLADALREFATPAPPKPEEPTGLGAIVERSDGRHWVRGPRDVWTNLDADGMYLNWSTWDQLNEASPVVKVHSEGVTG